MRKAIRLMAVSALLALPGASIAGEKFDGNWITKLVCPAKGNTEGYAWNIPSTIQNSNFHGERGTAGQGGYLSIDGKIKEDGSAKLKANGVVASRKYARGVFTTAGDDYSYDIKAQFEEAHGTGTKSAGLGIVGRECDFEFVKVAAGSAAGGR